MSMDMFYALLHEFNMLLHLFPLVPHSLSISCMRMNMCAHMCTCTYFFLLFRSFWTVEAEDLQVLMKWFCCNRLKMCEASLVCYGEHNMPHLQVHISLSVNLLLESKHLSLVFLLFTVISFFLGILHLACFYFQSKSTIARKQVLI